MANYKIIGTQGEDEAVRFLQANGYSIIRRNFRTKYGEIDIIALKNGILYCTEVKKRNSTKFGQPHEAINAKKIQRMVITAQVATSELEFTGEYKLLLVQIVSGNIILTELEL